MPVSKNRKKKKKKKKPQPFKSQNLCKKTSKPSQNNRLGTLKSKGLDFEVDYTKKHKHKVSKILLNFGAEFIESCRSDKEIERTISLLLICWNIGLSEEDKIEADIQEFIQKGNLYEVEDILRMLIKRKQTEYQEYRYLIADYEISFTKKDFHLNVASTEID